MAKLLNIAQVMERFEVTARSTIYRWMKAGDFPQPVKKWGSPMWNEGDIDARIAEKPRDRTPED